MLAPLGRNGRQSKAMFILTKMRNDIWDLEGRHIVMGGFLTVFWPSPVTGMNEYKHLRNVILHSKNT
jgi:hypothetical protein